MARLKETVSIFKSNFREEDYNDDNILFKIVSQGGKYFVEVYQSPIDIKQNKFSIRGTDFGGGGREYKYLIQDTLHYLLNSLIDGSLYKKVIIDDIGISKIWFWLVKEIDNYTYLKKSSSDDRKKYYSIIWYIKKRIQQERDNIKNFEKFFGEIFEEIEEQVQR
jgi:hypothetical protein